MKILLTGGAGFLGANLLEVLLNNGHEVAVFDLAKPGQECDFIKGDLRDLESLNKAAQKIDYILHLGGVGDVYLAAEKPYLAAACNVTGTANIMESALKNDIKKVIYASTWEVYGKPEYLPLDENHPCNPDHPYNITKYSGEQLALSYNHLKGTQVVSLRLGTAYGKWMRDNSVFSIFAKNALSGKGITIQGSGEQFRQFTHARDVAQAFIKAMESEVSGACFNIVSNEKISIKMLADYISKYVPTKITFTEARKGDIASAEVSSEKARKILGWAPAVTFDEGIKELIEYHKTRIKVTSHG